jgi:DNA modification methylase
MHTTGRSGDVITANIITADALDGLRTIPKGTIDTCITSPPYFGLRDYGIPGQIGLETTIDDYIERLMAVFREVHRTLKDDGTLWLNLGDSYAGAGKGGQPVYPNKHNAYRLKEKDLLGIPWAVAFALRADGWFLRQDIIWHKPNAMPESVSDRCTKVHEYIFLFSKEPRYYFDAEAIREAAVGYDNRPVQGSAGALGYPQQRARKGNARTFNETGLRNKRSVWSVATKSCREAHFATFPPELIRPCVLAGSRPGGIVLDPFFGAGTTGLVASQEGRRYIGIDINPAYCQIAGVRLGSQ